MVEFSPAETAILSLGGAVVLLAMSHVSGRIYEVWNHRRERRTEVYAQFIQATVALVIARRHDAQAQFVELESGLVDAKVRTCVYGSARVVSAIAGFEREGSTTATAAGVRAFTKIIEEMRHDVLSKNALPGGEEIALVIFGSASPKEGSQRE